MNWLTAFFNHIGVKQENGKWHLTAEQLMQLEQALGHEIARVFDPAGTVLIPEHLVHQMIKEHIAKF